MAKRLDGSMWHLLRGYTSAQATLCSRRPSSRQKGHSSPPPFSAMPIEAIYKRSPILATAELLSFYFFPVGFCLISCLRLSYLPVRLFLRMRNVYFCVVSHRNILGESVTFELATLKANRPSKWTLDIGLYSCYPTDNPINRCRWYSIGQGLKESENRTAQKGVRDRSPRSPHRSGVQGRKSPRSWSIIFEKKTCNFHCSFN